MLIHPTDPYGAGDRTDLFVEAMSGRYLPEAGTDVGIYIVGWYPIELWNATGDNRKTQAKKFQLGQPPDLRTVRHRPGDPVEP
ncbi:hypothetical protein ACGFOM_16600 [Streptomyces sp. NPDC048594]|uniref:hypothetical protein n=1 Tax=Streptomyces sp. NPDC048594 TaxID=3365575 RepID=UPI00371B1168